MSDSNQHSVCPVEKAGSLDTSFRRLIQNPRKILKPHIHAGMKVLDLGCGPGFFTMEMAHMVSDKGKVYAADLQQGMLDKVQQKIQGTVVENRVFLHHTKADQIGIEEKFDFALAFYMVHEVPSQDNLIKELHQILKLKGRLLIIEPNFHVSAKDFTVMRNKLKEFNFKEISCPKVFFSRTVLVEKD